MFAFLPTFSLISEHYELSMNYIKEISSLWELMLGFRGNMHKPMAILTKWRHLNCGYGFYWIWSRSDTHYILSSVNGKWQPWSLWSGCSKTCGGGNQQRNRICYGPFFGGQPCPGEQEEVRRCNEKKCPGRWMATQLSLLAVFRQERKSELFLAFNSRVKLFFLLSACEQNLMKYVERTTSPMLYGRWLQLGIRQQYVVLPMPWVSWTSSFVRCNVCQCVLMLD